MSKKGFTLLEIVVTVIGMLIIVTFGLATYRQVVDNARQRVCETNLKALETAVKISALEMGVLGKLEELKPEYLKRAYACIMEKEGWPLRFAYFFVKLTTSPQVYAQFLTPENLGKYGAEPQIFRCPADDSFEGISYSINEDLKGLAWDEILSGELLIAECDKYTFNPTSPDYSYRHMRKMGTEKIAKIIGKDGKVEDVKKNSSLLLGRGMPDDDEGEENSSPQNEKFRNCRENCRENYEDLRERRKCIHACKENNPPSPPSSPGTPFHR